MAKKDKNIKDKKQTNSFFKEMKAELKKVNWPTPKELFNNTVAVIAFVLVIAILVFLLDFVFRNINQNGVSFIHNKIESSYQSEEKSEAQSNETPTENQEGTQEGTEAEITNVEGESHEEATDNNGATVESN